LLIGNDTGPTHMAWGLNVPSITIFGPTPINRVYVTPINRVVKSSSTVNHYKLDKNDFSIREIEADEIIKIAKELYDAPQKLAELSQNCTHTLETKMAHKTTVEKFDRFFRELVK